MEKPTRSLRFGAAIHDHSGDSVKKIIGQVVSVHAGLNTDLGKGQQAAIDLRLDGVVGDRHRSFERETWAGDKQPEGVTRRNERQWSAVSIEELEEISKAMELRGPLSAECLGANICFSGVPEFSRLPKGTVLQFPSGAELTVEEYNPPCHEMGKKISSSYKTQSGEPISTTAFSKAAKLTRGVVGVVDVAGTVNTGDDVTIILYETPPWLARRPD